MNIYFVRHGQTECNELHLSQGEHGPLTKTGVKQARMVAKRVKSLPIDIIIASPMERAAQTAGIIQKALRREIIYSDLLKEHRRPSVMIGKRTDSPLMAEINRECNLHQDDINWHYSDEENFLEYQVRALKALEYLESLPQENILVVSHGNFIKMLVLTMALGDLLQPEVLYAFTNKVRMKNTGLTHCKKDGADWSIESLNDHRHLMENTNELTPKQEKELAAYRANQDMVPDAFAAALDQLDREEQAAEKKEEETQKK